LIGASAAVTLATRQTPRAWLRSTLAILAAVAVCETFFYLRSPPVFFGVPPPLPTLRYLGGAAHRVIPLFEAAIGFLGWTDYKLRHAYYVVTGVLLLSNASLWARRRQFDTADIFLLSFALLFVIGTFAGEYVVASSELLQGRYFLPAGIGFSVVTRHRVAWCQVTTLGWLALLNVLMLHMSVERYYAGNYPLLLQALPFFR
jgi:hypothetical protein